MNLFIQTTGDEGALSLTGLYCFVMDFSFIVDLDDSNIWTEYLQEQVQFFHSAMLMAIEN